MQFVGAFVCGNDFLLDICAEVIKSIDGGDMANLNRVKETSLSYCKNYKNKKVEFGSGRNCSLSFDYVFLGIRAPSSAGGQ